MTLSNKSGSANSNIVKQYLKVMSTSKNLSKRTIRAYESDLMDFARYLQGRPIVDSRFQEISDYIESLRFRSLESSTTKRKIASLRGLFGYLRDEGLIVESPLAKLSHRFRTSRKLPKILTASEIEQLLRSLTLQQASQSVGEPLSKFCAERNRAMIELLFATGIRVDELLSLNSENVDVKAQTLVVNGKGRRERALYISSSEVIDALTNYLTLRNELFPKNNAFFLNSTGSRLGHRSVHKIFTRELSRANINRSLSPHCLRHTVATMLVENGADLRSVQDILGHSRISTTEIYVHVSTKRKQDIMRNFNPRNKFSVI